MIGGIEDGLGGLRSSPQEQRLVNYLSEEASLRQKLVNPNVPPEKKERCRSRLQDLNTRLIPQLHHAM
jgi:hypothetical protein